MSNSNINLQTQSSNALHNAIMEAGSKDRPPMLAPGNYVQWKSRIKRYIDTKPNSELIHYCLQNPPYTYQWAEKTVPVAEGIDNESTPQLMPVRIIECGKPLNKLKQVNQSMFKILNQFILELENSHHGNGESLNRILTEKSTNPTKQQPRTSSNTRRANQDNSSKKSAEKPKRVKDAAYHKEKMLLCKQEKAGVQLNAKQADWKDDTDDESDDQELEAHYMFMVQVQEITPDQVDNSGPIFDDEPMHKVQNNHDNYNVFAMENEHPEQPESSNHIYLAEQGDTNITIDSLDICYDRDQDDQDDTDDLDQERDFLASLIQKLKCEIDNSKN
ncbi:hypothetical protein Tco_1225239 [Tanacetum coccineum]